MAAADLLAQDFGVQADVWSVTSYTELRREGQECERWSRLHPLQDARRGYAETCLAATQGPVVAATDYMKTVAEQIRPFTAGRRYVTLGTDGFGRSDTRQALRAFFEVDRYHIALAALKALADDGVVPRAGGGRHPALRHRSRGRVGGLALTGTAGLRPAAPAAPRRRRPTAARRRPG